MVFPGSVQVGENVSTQVSAEQHGAEPGAPGAPACFGVELRYLVSLGALGDLRWFLCQSHSVVEAGTTTSTVNQDS
jgi:hypothetical protein